MCGLFGFIPKKGRKANLMKIKLLGVFNTERGTDSCGYYYAGNIEKGIGNQSDFKDFITKEIVRGELAEDIFIGHTRRSTSGSHNYNNAHPHLINERYVQTHNGVIENWIELCHKYDVKTGPIYVDSIGLGSIIEKHNSFNVLNEYEGKAALVMLFKDKPNSVFFYRGASKTTQNGVKEEERPLYLIQESEGIYYSSMRNSLEAIKSSSEIEVKSLTVNNVWEVKNGEIQKAKSVFVVDRGDSNVVKKSNHSKSLTSSEILGGRVKQEEAYSTTYSKFNDRRFKSTIRVDDSNDKSEKDHIYKEEFIKYDVAYGKFKIQYCRGRYYGENNMLLTGKYYIDSSGVVLHDEFANNIIKRSREKKEQPNVREFWFLNGVLLRKGENSFNTLREFGCLTKSPSEEVLSLHSAYPVIVDSRNAEYKNTKWFKNGKLVSHKDTFSPIFSRNTYSIKNGRTSKITKGVSIKVVI